MYTYTYTYFGFASVCFLWGFALAAPLPTPPQNFFFFFFPCPSLLPQNSSAPPKKFFVPLYFFLSPFLCPFFFLVSRFFRAPPVFSYSAPSFSPFCPSSSYSSLIIRTSSPPNPSPFPRISSSPVPLFLRPNSSLLSSPLPLLFPISVQILCPNFSPNIQADKNRQNSRKSVAHQLFFY